MFGLRTNLLAYLWLSAATVLSLCGRLGVFLLVFMAVGSFYYILGLESNIIIVGLTKLFYAGLVLYYRGCRLLIMLAMFGWVSYVVLEASVLLSAMFYRAGFKYVILMLLAYSLAYVFWRGRWATMALVIRVPRTYVFVVKSYLLLWGFAIVCFVAVWVTASAAAMGEVQNLDYGSGFIFARLLI